MAQTIKLKRSAVAGRIPDLSVLELGEIAINTYDGKMYIKKNVDGTETVVEVGHGEGQEPIEGVWKQYSYTASAGQTSFSGSDNNSQTLLYSVGYIEVYLNGILLDPAVDYTATTGNQIDLAVAAELNDLVQISSFSSVIGAGDIVVNTFTGDDTTTSFTLSNIPGTKQNVSVFIDGVYQEKDTYSLSGPSLIFVEAPYVDASIEAVIGSRNITINDIENLVITGNFAAEGTISGTSATLTGALASGSVTTGNIDSSGTIDADGDITTIADVNANNVVATNDITATGDVEGSSLTLTGSAGAMTWNNEEETLDIPLNSEVTLQTGQEVVFRVKATEAIANGEVVMFAGAQGNHILAARADSNAVGFQKELVIGIATQDFSTNEYGFVTELGKVRDLDTSAWSEGDLLWLSDDSPGVLTNVEPSAPNHGILIASVLRDHQNDGTIFVRPSYKPDFGELCDTDFSTLADNEIVAYDASSGTWVNKTLEAANVDYDSTVSGISANTVQEAIDYLNTLSGGGNQGDVASYTRQTFVGTDGASNTTFTLTDGYTLGYLEVYLNGVLLNNSDYTANDESTVVLATAARDEDELITIAHDSFAIAELLRTTSISASAPDDAITLDASGNVLIGKTSTAFSTEGFVYERGAAVEVTTDANRVMRLNRTSSDGNILELNKDGSTVGSIGTALGELFINPGTTGSLLLGGGASNYWQILNSLGSGQARLRPTGDGTTNIGDATKRVKDLYLSGGVYLGGTGADNNLDYYEEGTWTPVFGVNTSQDWNVNALTQADYVRVGKTVMLNLFIPSINPSTYGATGTWIVSGLPFPMAAESVGAVQWNSGITLPAGRFSPAIRVGTNLVDGVGRDTLMIRNSSNDGGGHVALDAQHMGSVTYMRIFVSYMTN